MSDNRGRRARVAAVCLATAAGGMTPVGAHAQPIREVDGQYFVTIPTEVHATLAESTFDLVTVEIGPVNLEELDDLLPESVPVVSVFPDGTRRDGFYSYNRFAEPVISVPYYRPTVVHYGENGYTVGQSLSYSGARVTELGVATGEMYPPGFAWRSEVLSRVRVWYTLPPEHQVADGGWDILWTLGQVASRSPCACH